jgi:hypothetical protein
LRSEPKEGELAAAVDGIIKARWELRDGQVVPDTEDITLGNSGVTLDARVLYADLADSTELALFDREIAAEVYKAYLIGTTRLIKAAGGEIRSRLVVGIASVLFSCSLCT